MTSDPARILRFTDEAMAALRELAKSNPGLWRNPETGFTRILREEREVQEPVEDTGLTALGPIEMPAPEQAHRQKMDRHALAFLDNIPGMTPAHMADGNLLAWLSCIHLLEFGIARWPFHQNTGPVNWVNQHFLGERGRDLTDYNVAGRLLWMAEHSRKIAAELPTLREHEILDHFSNNAEQYHQCTNFQVMRSTKVVSEFTNAMMGTAKGISRAGALEVARDLNRAAGARLLDATSRGEIRMILERSVDEVMRQEKYVTDRTMLRGVKAFRVLSLGAGVQSTVMALMAEQGYDGFEKPDLAIFADTGWEPKAVYENVAWLEEQLSYPVVRVANGNIKDSILSGTNPEGRRFIDIPLYVKGPNGRMSVAKRQCTRIYKMEPIYKYLREYLGIEPGKKANKNIKVEMWLGITIDEASRQKPARREWIENQYPLIDRRISRAQLMVWFQNNYPSRTLPKSACIGCPYHSDALWAEMKRNDPESFQEAVFVDTALREVPQSRGSLTGTGYLHKSLIPLSEVDFSSTVPESEAFQQECEGLCGI